MGKIIKSPDDLSSLAFYLKNVGFNLVQGSGCFDYFHYGHLKYLRKAKTFGEYLFITINSDESIRRIKGEKRPFVKQDWRAEILASLVYVDFVYIFDDDLPNRTIELIRPDFYVKGVEYEHKDIPEKVVIERIGGRIIYLDTVVESSTKMMKVLEKYINGGGEFNG